MKNNVVVMNIPCAHEANVVKWDNRVNFTAYRLLKNHTLTQIG